jgi:hypothetical protein
VSRYTEGELELLERSFTEAKAAVEDACVEFSGVTDPEPEDTAFEHVAARRAAVEELLATGGVLKLRLTPLCDHEPY